MPKNLKSQAEGCCVIKDDNANNCDLTTEQKCSFDGGKFYKDDLRCAKANCRGWNCKPTYNYAKDDFSG